MTAIPRVFTSGELVARAAGVDMHLLTVEVWHERVTVRLIGAMNDDVRGRIDAYEDEMNAWFRRRQAGEDTRPPRSVGEEIGRALTVRVADDVGTAYQWIAGGTGGTGTELLCEWAFEPGMPPDAAELTVTFATADGETNYTVR